MIFNHCSRVGSIGFRSIEYDLFIFQSIKVNFQPIESLKEILRSSLPCSIGTQSIKIRKERKIKRIPQHVFFTFFSKTFSYFFLPFLDQSTQSNFCHFPGQNLQGFSSYIFMDFFSQHFEQRKIGSFIVLVVFNQV